MMRRNEENHRGHHDDDSGHRILMGLFYRVGRLYEDWRVVLWSGGAGLSDGDRELWRINATSSSSCSCWELGTSATLSTRTVGAKFL